jgi:IK cytokine
MNNQDFRKLLETPRAERWADETPRGGSGASEGAAAKAKKPAGEHKPHRPKPGHKKPTEKGKEEEDPDALKYR